MFVPFMLIACLAPAWLERWYHRNRPAQIARFAFLPVGERRIVRAVADAPSYRAPALSIDVPRLPPGEWSVRRDEGGRVDLWVAEDGTHAVARVDVPWIESGWRPTPVIATLRVRCERDANGVVLRARALPSPLAIWWGLPLGIAVAVATMGAPLGVALALFGVSSLAVAILQIFPLGLIWLFEGPALRNAASQTLDVLAAKLEPSSPR